MQANTKIKQMALTGLMGALALVLAYLEGLLPPLPMLPPGAKIGLSNIVNMFAAGAAGLPSALFIALIKGAFALFTRGAVAGVMSISGGVISTFAAWILLKKTGVSFITTGVICALCHNIAQLFAAYFITGAGMLAYAPSIVILGSCSGVLTGIALKLVYARLNKIKL